MRGSDMSHDRRNAAEVGDAFDDSFNEALNLGAGVFRPEGEAHAGARIVTTQPHGEEDMRRLDRAAGTGGAGGNGITAKIESDHHGFTGDAGEEEIRSVGHAPRGVAVDACALDCGEDFRFKAVTEFGEARPILTQRGGGSESDGTGDVLCAGAAVAFVMAAIEQRFERDALAELRLQMA